MKPFNKKSLFVLLGGGVFVSIVAVAIVYFYGGQWLLRLPPLLKTSLAAQGVLLGYEKVEQPKGALSLALNQVTVQGDSLPYEVSALQVLLHVQWASAFPPVKVVLSIRQPTLTKNADYVVLATAAASESKRELSPTALKYASLAASYLNLEAQLLEAQLPDFGVSSLSAKVRVHSLGLGPHGLERAVLSHELSLGSVDKVAYLGSIASTGRTSLAYPNVLLDRFQIRVGPLSVDMEGKVALDTQKWLVSAKIPESQLKETDTVLDPKFKNVVSSLTGLVSLSVEAQGLGVDPQTILASGNVSAQNMKILLTHPNAEGEALGTIKASFRHERATQFDLNLSSDLSGLSLKDKENFAKAKGIPLNVAVEAKGNERGVKVNKAEGRFHNLEFSASGDVASTDDLSGNLSVTIKPTELTGWEQFFPKYSHVKSSGKLAGQLQYTGPLKRWREALILLSLKAQSVKLPIVKALIPNPDLDLDGVLQIDSDTDVRYSKGVLSSLMSKTDMDLTQVGITFKDQFRKPANQKMNLKLDVASTQNKATIKTGNFEMGSLRAVFSGAVENFLNPVAKIKFETNEVGVKELASWSPKGMPSNISGLNGSVVLRGSLNGKHFIANVSVKNVTAVYLKEPGKFPIKLNRLSGLINVTPDSLSTKKLQVAFPNSQAEIDFNIKSFTSPVVNLSMRSQKWSLLDFVEKKAASEKAPAGLLGVPASAKPKDKSDFRDNEYVKHSKVSADIRIAALDLGEVRASQFLMKINYDKLLLKITPLSLNVYGGTLSSTTEWNGRSKVPTTKQALQVSNIDSNAFLSSYSEKVKDVVFGKLNLSANLTFQGLTPEEMKKTTQGKGNFSLAEGGVKSVRLTQKPLEALRAISVLSRAITKTEWDEKLNTIQGDFTIQNSQVVFGPMVMRSPVFDAVASNTTYSFEHEVKSSILWVPKENLVRKDSLKPIWDEKGQPSVPLTVSGPIQSPHIGVDDSALQGRAKLYASRLIEEEKNKQMKRLEEEKNRQVEQARQKAQAEAEKALGEGVKGLFK